MKFNILIEENRWRDIDLDKLLRNSVSIIPLDICDYSKNYEISLLACNEKKISALNLQFLGKKGGTNILSWPEYDLRSLKAGDFPSKPPVPNCNDETVNLGNLAISYETIIKEAVAECKTLEDHILHLLIHGYLHLLGFDHEEKLSAELMEKIEKKALFDLGVSNPYLVEVINR